MNVSTLLYVCQNSHFNPEVLTQSPNKSPYIGPLYFHVTKSVDKKTLTVLGLRIYVDIPCVPAHSNYKVFLQVSINYRLLMLRQLNDGPTEIIGLVRFDAHAQVQWFNPLTAGVAYIRVLILY